MDSHDCKIAEYLKVIDEVIANGEYKDNWESLSKYPVPKWYNQGKLGIFSHWGVFTVPEYICEWYPRFMYHRGHPVHKYHQKTYGADFQYKDFIPMFKGEKFDAKSWIDLIKTSGADFYMPVAEHHDGFKLHRSALSKWNSVEMAMNRDIIGELKEECSKNDIVFGMSNHRAEHYFFMNGMKTLNDKTREEAEKYADFYGPCHNPFKWNFVANILNYFIEKIDTPKEWRESWLAHACEQVDLYRPKEFYFDWIVHRPEYRPEMKKFLAYYYNRSVEWGEEVCLAYKRDALMYGCGIYDRERGQLPSISKEKWQCDTSTSKNAWIYCKTNKWKSAKNLAGTFVDVVSKNGNLLLNICPKADGSFCEAERKLIAKFGAWNEVHRDAIWHTKPYKVFGEGAIKSSGTMKEKDEFNADEYRFTYKK